jgi:hypothetical protein
MKLKVIAVLVLLVAIFPAVATGLAQEIVHAVLQAVGHLVGGSGG